MGQAEAIVWTFHLLGLPCAVSPYVLFAGIGLIVALFMLEASLKRALPEHQGYFYVWLVLSGVFGWIGAHLLDCLVTSRSFGQAGFTFYGGLVAGTSCFALSGLLLRKEIIWTAVNAAIVPLVVAHSIGRVGCFFAGCCYGVQCHRGPCWPFARQPTQLYETVFLAVFSVALANLKGERFGLRLFGYGIGYGLFRFFVEFIRNDERGHFVGLSTSQWGSVALICCILVVILARRVVAAGDVSESDRDV